MPHGQTNATVLPIILRLYDDSVASDLAELADEAGIADKEASDSEKAAHFIDWIEQMNESMGIAKYIPEIREEDLDALTNHAVKEAHPLYPVPVIFTPDEIKNAYRIVKGEVNEYNY